ncbi:hypothetical protein [Sinorhizobium fredii]|nr:hypothetical protein [Sinorhizobium fredii]
MGTRLKARAAIRKPKCSGIKFALDDFGCRDISDKLLGETSAA